MFKTFIYSINFKKWGGEIMTVPQLSLNIWNLKAFLYSFSVEIMVEFPGQFALAAKAGTRVEKYISLRIRRSAVCCFSNHLNSLGQNLFICNVRVFNQCSSQSYNTVVTFTVESQYITQVLWENVFQISACLKYIFLQNQERKWKLLQH